MTENKNNKRNIKTVLKAVGYTAAKTVGISGVVLGTVAIAVPALGFGALGVTGGSLAAAYQSAVLGGTIASGSLFATLQSIGAVGLALSTKIGIIAGSATVSTAHTAVKKILKKDEETDSEDDDDNDFTKTQTKEIAVQKS